ncbi:Protein Ycf2, partial [Mucuna pruriens]
LLEESFESSNINRLIVLLLYLSKGQKISRIFSRIQKRGSWWWRNMIGKRMDSSCKISNEITVGIEISFKEKDIKYLELLFVYYTDDLIHKKHD